MKDAGKVPSGAELIDGARPLGARSWRSFERALEARIDDAALAA